MMVHCRAQILPSLRSPAPSLPRSPKNPGQKRKEQTHDNRGRDRKVEFHVLAFDCDITGEAPGSESEACPEFPEKTSENQKGPEHDEHFCA